MARRRKVPVASGSGIFLMLVVVFGLLLVGSGKVNLGDVSGWESILVGVTVLGFIVGLALVVVAKMREGARLRALEVADIDQMGGVEFERYVGKLLEFQGYKVQFTKASGDFGIDILVSKDGKHYAIQIKRYKGSVNREAVNDAVGGMAKYRKDAQAMVITNNYFTDEAKELARFNNCVLIDRDTLAQWILEYQRG